MSNNTLPILGKAEILAHEVPFGHSFNPKKEICSYEEAKNFLLPQLEDTIQILTNIPQDKSVKSGVFFTVDLDSAYIAKSYFPKTLFDKAGWHVHGSIATQQKIRNNINFPQSKTARKLFLQAPINAIENIYQKLLSNSFTTEQERSGIQKLSAIGTHSTMSKLHGVVNTEDNILELIIHPLCQPDWQYFLTNIKSILATKDYPAELFNWEMGRRLGGPIFLPIKADLTLATEVASFNPVRAIRPMAKVVYPRFLTNESYPCPLPKKSLNHRSLDIPYIGIFDGGVDTTIPHLGPWVVQKELTTKEAEPEYLEHGTAVCGATLYGQDPRLATEQPSFRAKSFRVLPPPSPSGIPELDLYSLIKLIEETVTSSENADIKTYVLSFGPNNPIDDTEIDLFTTTLDRLAFEHDILFVIAAGNDGELSPPYNRIQPPADMVNGLGIGAFAHTPDNNPTKTPYSCVGPGRTGNSVKPDIHMFGGTSVQPFMVFRAGGNGDCAKTCGTSFAAPLACNLAGHLLYRAEDNSTLTPQTVKALLIHKSIAHDNWNPNWGWGALEHDLNALVTCAPNKVTLLYNGDLSIGKRTLLEIPLPSEVLGKKTVKLSWTLVYATDTSPTMPDEYTLAGASIKFRPHCDVFTYTTENGKSKTINKLEEPELYEQLKLQNIIKETALPKTFSPTCKQHSMTEAERRNFGVWDTTRHYWTKFKQSRTLKNPTLDIHAQARSDWQYDAYRPRKIRYACVVTIETRARIDLYQAIKSMVPALVPVKLRHSSRVRT